MKKLLLFIYLLSVTICGHSQSTQNSTCDSILVYITEQLASIEYRISPSDRYKLYPTENIYTFLKLDTATGRIEQLQWSLDNDKEFTVTINNEDLSFIFPENGTFELYPTKNMYQFLLLDKVRGRQWHVQWGMSDKKRWIRRF